MDEVDSRTLSLELLKSIRDIDSRIDEIRLILLGRSTNVEERRQTLQKRVEKLIETRFCLLSSFADINPSFGKHTDSTNPFEAITSNYSTVKRQIKSAKI